MSYQVLARKWRPRRFVETVGQEHVLKALINALDEDRLHHAYLFTGTRGVGKTSIARLFAKALNCQQGVSSEPCGSCSACTEIAEGRFVDLIEVDAASRTKVEDTRELLENVQYAPTQGRYKVYLIDEVHMLSTSSFNALLKTLEEPPPHVKFLLATTDPQKLPVTILSRCLQFNLKNMAPEKIVTHLQYVLGEEQIAFDDASLWLIARSADGSMRDALSLTDQAIAFGSGRLSEVDVRTMLGTIDHRLVFELLQSLVNNDGKQMLDRVTAMAEFSPDYSGVLAEMISILHRVALCQVVPEAIDNSLGDEAQVRALSSNMRAEEVQLCYQIALTGRRDMPLSPNPREALEMVLLRMLAFRPADKRPIDPVPDEQAVKTSSQSVESIPPVQASKGAADAPAPSSLASVNPDIHRSTESFRSDDPPPWEEAPLSAYEDDAVKKSETDSIKVESTPLESVVPKGTVPMSVLSTAPENAETGEALSTQLPPDLTIESEVLPESNQGNESVIDLFGEPTPLATYDKPAEILPETSQNDINPNLEGDVKLSSEAIALTESSKDHEPSEITLAHLSLEHWVHLVGLLGLSGMTESLAKALSFETMQGNTLVFHYTPEQEALLNDIHRQRIAGGLNSYFGEPLNVQFELAEQTLETPANYRIRRAEERRLAAVKHLKQDPNVRNLLATFGGQLDELSVEPLDIE